ncbi:lycopene cyclase domain-containing protein [Saccharothrix stipae]
MGPEYLIAAVASVGLTVAAELLLLRTGLFRRPAYWLTMAIVFAFQVPVDGWLTKLSAPVVIYAPTAISGLRVPWDIPVEDFLFGFSMITLTLLLWERARARKAAAR